MARRLPVPAHSPARLGNPASRLQVSLVEQPQFGFELTLYGGDITLLPGLEAWLTAVIRDAVLGPFVLPGRFTFPLSPAATSASPLPRGMLFVTAVGARGLPRMDLFSKTDAYVRQETGVGDSGLPPTPALREQGWEGARSAGGLRAVAGGGTASPKAHPPLLTAATPAPNPTSTPPPTSPSHLVQPVGAGSAVVAHTHHAQRRRPRLGPGVSLCRSRARLPGTCL